MRTQEDDVDAHALRKRGWTISAIARHLGHDRKTIRAYLNGDRVAGVRARAGEDRFGPFVEYCRERLLEDLHLWAMTLFDEIVVLGFVQSYPTFTRQLRIRSMRPHCERCQAAKGRPVAIIDHPGLARKHSGTGLICPTHQPAGVCDSLERLSLDRKPRGVVFPDRERRVFSLAVLSGS